MLLVNQIMDFIDLNLLRVFDVIYRTRNVSRAAEQLGMSQPSTSQAQRNEAHTESR